MRISAVINTLNEEKNIETCLKSLAGFTDEIIVCDMHSDDDTVKLAKKYTKNVFLHKRLTYVEPARNFALSRATGDWILVLDADEELPVMLGKQLKELANGDFTYYRLPHKNIIFGKWIKHSGWWPDYHIRFFKKGQVSWGDDIHSIPITMGKGSDLVASEDNALIHHSYISIDQFLARLNRYTSQEVIEQLAQNKTFTWQNLLLAPTEEFIRRFFVWDGYKDGLHGLVLACLQAVSFLIVQLKLWEQTKFKEEKVSLVETLAIYQKIKSQIHYWFYFKLSETHSGVSKKLVSLRAKLNI